MSIHSNSDLKEDSAREVGGACLINFDKKLYLGVIKQQLKVKHLL